MAGAMVAFFLALLVALAGSAAAIAASVRSSPSTASLFNATLKSWLAFRDPENGLYCDSITFTRTMPGVDTFPCSSGSGNQRYSSASTGFGLVVDTILAELGYLPREEAERRANLTFASIQKYWPRSPQTGLLVHWTSPSASGPWPATEGGWSTIDTAELVAGVLFAGKYFGGELETAAKEYASEIKWECSIVSKDGPGLYALFDPKNESGKAAAGVCQGEGGDLLFSGELWVLLLFEFRPKPEGSTQTNRDAAGRTRPSLRSCARTREQQAIQRVLPRCGPRAKVSA